MTQFIYIPLFFIESGPWHLDLKNGSGAAGKGRPASGDHDVTMTLNESDFVQMFAGKLDATSAFMSGKLKIKGNMGLAMKLQKFMKNMPKPAAAGSGAGAAAGGDAGGVEATFQQIRPLLNENIVKDIDGVFAFELKGKSVMFFSLPVEYSFKKLMLVLRKMGHDFFKHPWNSWAIQVVRRQIFILMFASWDRLKI